MELQYGQKLVKSVESGMILECFRVLGGVLAFFIFYISFFFSQFWIYFLLM